MIMAGGFFKNMGTDLRRLVEKRFLEEYRFTFLEETFRYAYTRSNSVVESQTYTYKSLINELQKKNINITDIIIAPANAIPTMFGMLRLTCIFKNGRNPITIQLIPRNLESVMDDYSRMMDEI